MKNAISLFVLLLLSSAIVGQDKFSRAFDTELRGSKEQAATFFRQHKKAISNAMIPIYMTDFSTGIPSSWSNVDSAGHGRHWYYSANACFRCDSIYLGAGIDSLSVLGTSAANGIAMYDSDSGGVSIGGDYGVLTTNPINCSGYSSVHLQFNELFVYCNDLITPAYPNTARVYVSNDNVNFYRFHQAEMGLFNCGESTNNPNPVDIDISALAANRSTVYIRFSFTGDYSYWWFIDDVSLVQPSPYDAAITNIEPVFNGCTLSAATPITIEIKNSGTQPISNFPVSYSINGGSQVIETITTTIQPNAYLSYTFNQTANLSVPSVYQLVAAVNLSGDAYQLNNTDTLNTLSIPSSPVPYFNGLESAYDFRCLTLNDLDHDGRSCTWSNTNPHSGAYAIEFNSPATNQGDNWAFTSCLDLSTSPLRLDYWTKQSGQPTNYILQSYLCTSPHPADTLMLLDAGSVATDTNYESHTTIFSSPSNGIYYLGFRWSGTGASSSMFLDDILLDLVSTTAEHTGLSALIIYPNPVTDEIRLHVNSNLSAVVKILDQSGRIVLEKSFAAANDIELNLQSLTSGSYVLQLENSSGMIRKKLIKFDR